MRAVKTVEGAARRPGLVPLGDFFNHAPEAFANVLSASDPAKEVFEYYATRPIRKGDPALLSYSLKSEPSNAKLLLDYGFCIAYSPHDEVSVALMPPPAGGSDDDTQAATESPPVNPPTRGHLALLKALELIDYASTARLSLEGDVSQPPPQLIASGRVLVLTPAELASATPEGVLGEVTRDFELRALRYLAGRIDARLAKYDRVTEYEHGPPPLSPTHGSAHGAAHGAAHEAAHEADERELAYGGWRQSGGSSCALHVRTGERRILLHWLRRLNALIADAAVATGEARGGRAAAASGEAGGAAVVDVAINAAGAIGSAAERDPKPKDVRRQAHGDGRHQPGGEVGARDAAEAGQESFAGHAHLGKVLHTFPADAVAWDAVAEAPLPTGTAATKGIPNAGAGGVGGGAAPPLELEVRMIDTTSRKGDRKGEIGQEAATRLRGVVVGPRSRVLRGRLLGCYTGRVVGPDERAAKSAAGSGGGASALDAYSFPINRTHAMDPTEPDGSLPNDTPHGMALVNEPRGDAMPNVWPMEYRFGGCRDRDGRPGVPYYAAREILAGEEVTVCYGPNYDRSSYTEASTCANGALLSRWSALQDLVLRPLLHTQRQRVEHVSDPA